MEKYCNFLGHPIQTHEKGRIIEALPNALMHCSPKITRMCVEKQEQTYESKRCQMLNNHNITHKFSRSEIHTPYKDSPMWVCPCSWFWVTVRDKHLTSRLWKNRTYMDWLPMLTTLLFLIPSQVSPVSVSLSFILPFPLTQTWIKTSKVVVFFFFFGIGSSEHYS